MRITINPLLQSSYSGLDSLPLDLVKKKIEPPVKLSILINLSKLDFTAKIAVLAIHVPRK